MHHSGRSLDLLTSGDAALLFLAGRRSQVVVKSTDMSCPRRFTDDRGTLAIVFPDNLLVVIKVEIATP